MTDGQRRISPSTTGMYSGIVDARTFAISLSSFFLSRHAFERHWNTEGDGAVLVPMTLQSSHIPVLLVSDHKPVTAVWGCRPAG